MLIRQDQWGVLGYYGVQLSQGLKFDIFFPWYPALEIWQPTSLKSSIPHIWVPNISACNIKNSMRQVSAFQIAYCKNLRSNFYENCETSFKYQLISLCTRRERYERHLQDLKYLITVFYMSKKSLKITTSTQGLFIYIYIYLFIYLFIITVNSEHSVSACVDSAAYIVWVQPPPSPLTTCFS